MNEFTANDDQWDKAYKTFLHYTDLQGKIEQCFKENLSKVLERINLPANSALNILSIGAGNGRMDKKILEIVIDWLGPASKSVFNRAIEPNSETIEQYKHWMKLEKCSHHSTDSPLMLKAVKVNFEFVNKDFDEYTAGKNDPRIQFDLIHAVHSFYFVKDVQQSLLHCYESELKEKGAIMLVAGRKRAASPFYKVTVCLEDNIDSYSSTLGKYMGSEGFVEIAQRYKYEYDVHPFNYSIDVIEIFCPGSPSGLLLLGFFTFEKDFHRRFDKNVVQEVCNVMRNAAKKDKNGRLIVQGLDDLVVIHKPSQRL